MQARFPFSALVGQEQMKLALLLNAINPRLGGVLIRGEKGTAKSTAARAVADLLPRVTVVRESRFACDPAGPLCVECAGRTTLDGVERPASFVELPVGATEDRVVGTLDLERALSHGERQFEAGLLARANRGLLYVDEVNLLPDHLVDTLLDAAAMGTNTVEREGVSFSHPASFVLIGTMNPEEGEVRPQLLDRFALAVDVAGMSDPLERAEVVRRRILYETDPRAFAERWSDAEADLRARVLLSRTRLPRVELDDRLLELIARICTEFEVDGLRADLVIYKAALTLAAFAGRLRVTADDVRMAAELALPHRRRRQPFDQPGLDRDRLSDVVREHAPPDDAANGAAQNEGEAEPVAEEVIEPDAVEVIEPDAVPPLSVSIAVKSGAMPQPGARRAVGQHVEADHGRHVRSVAGTRGALDVVATLLAAAPLQRARGRAAGRIWLERSDVRVKVRETRTGRCTLFVVDASGSMAAKRRMAVAKGAVLSLLLDAYQHRDEVGLIAFRGVRAELLLAPTRSAALASARLRGLPTGGKTPLAAALRLAQSTLASLARRGRGARSSLVVLVSDGRANVGVDGGDALAEALAAASALRALDVAALVVDSEDGPVRLGLARRLCALLKGQYVRLEDLHAGGAQALADTVRSAHAWA